EDRSRKASETAELFADGLRTNRQLRIANRDAGRLSRIRMQEAASGHDLGLFKQFSLTLMGARLSDEFVLVAAHSALDELRKIDEASTAVSSALLRCII